MNLYSLVKKQKRIKVNLFSIVKTKTKSKSDSCTEYLISMNLCENDKKNQSEFIFTCEKTKTHYSKFYFTCEKTKSKTKFILVFKQISCIKKFHL